MSLVNTNDNVIDISLKQTAKKRFRIDGDDDRILELNTSDMSIINRLNTIYPKLQQLATDAATKLDVGEEEDTQKALDASAKALTEIDTDMRNLIDELFDSNVSEVCCVSGSMYDPFNGKFRFEHIIETLSGLYETNLKNEFNKMSKNVKKHTDKYIKPNK